MFLLYIYQVYQAWLQKCMLKCSTEPQDSTNTIEALPGKLNIKSLSILSIYNPYELTYSTTQLTI